MRCAVTKCPDRATSRVTFLYPAEAVEAGARGKLADYDFCGRHSWPWRSGRGNGTVEVEMI